MDFPKKLKILSVFFVLFFAFNSFAIEDYLTELESVSKREIPASSKKILRKHLREHDLTEIDGESLEISHANFNRRRPSIIETWEENTAQKWLSYKEPVNCVIDETTICKHTGWKYDAHHIIPQSYGGPNEWWNVFPLTARQHNKIHKSGKCCEFFPKSCGIRK